MSCPDWPLLTARREALGEDPPGWRADLEHLRSCPACREAALAADPSLVFHRLPAATVDEGEVAAMQQAVATLVRADQHASRSPGVVLRWLRPAAAAALLAATLSLGPAGPAPQPAAAPTTEQTARAPVASVPTTASSPAATVLIENLDLPEARVYQLPHEDLPVVMIVDSSLDV